MTTDNLLRSKIEQVKPLEIKFGIDISITKIISSKSNFRPNGICVYYTISSVTSISFNTIHVNFVIYNKEDRIRMKTYDYVANLLNTLDNSINKEYFGKFIFDLPIPSTNVGKILVYPSK